jgi:hypothetical protein
VAGAAIAVVLYHMASAGYTMATAYLLPPGDLSEIADMDVRAEEKNVEDREDRLSAVIAQAQQIADRLAKEEGAASQAPESASTGAAADEASSLPADEHHFVAIELQPGLELEPASAAPLVEVAAEESSAPAMLLRENAPSLPSSGAGMCIGFLLALGVSSLTVPRVRTWMQTRM